MPSEPVADVTPCAGAVAGAVAGAAGRGVPVLALAAVEARFLVRHPVTLFGLLLYLVNVAVAMLSTVTTSRHSRW